MRIVSYVHNGRTYAGLLDGDVVQEAGDDPIDPRPTGTVLPLDSVRLLAPVPRPGKVICIGLNYYDHAAESEMTVPERPLLFTKFANAVIGPQAPIQIPVGSTQVDYEAELAVVIGRPAQRVPADQALDHVLGYTCSNDVSARDMQFADGQWFRGKGQDTFCPLGPWIVTPDELPDPQTLGIRCTVNGVVLQDDSTKQMIFPVAELISYITEGITLEPGDVILTGTPVGVGFARTPPVFLGEGDEVVVEIEGIGQLISPVVGRPS